MTELENEEEMKNKCLDLSKDLMMIVENHEDQLSLEQIFYFCIRHFITGAYIGFCNEAGSIIQSAAEDAMKDYGTYQTEKRKAERDENGPENQP